MPFTLTPCPSPTGRGVWGEIRAFAVRKPLSRTDVNVPTALGSEQEMDRSCMYSNVLPAGRLNSQRIEFLSRGRSELKCLLLLDLLD